MNVGQVLETHLGWVAKTGWEVDGETRPGQQRLADDRRRPAAPGTNVATPVFDGAREEEITGLLGSTRCPTATACSWSAQTGKARLFDGRSGEPFPTPVVGRLHLHPEAAPPGRRQDPRPLDRPVLDDHAAAAGR